MARMAHIYPLHILVVSLAGWINHQQGEVLEYLIEENRVCEVRSSRLSSGHRSDAQVMSWTGVAARPYGGTVRG